MNPLNKLLIIVGALLALSCKKPRQDSRVLNLGGQTRNITLTLDASTLTIKAVETNFKLQKSESVWSENVLKSRPLQLQARTFMQVVPEFDAKSRYKVGVVLTDGDGDTICQTTGGVGLNGNATVRCVAPSPTPTASPTGSPVASTSVTNSPSPPSTVTPTPASTLSNGITLLDLIEACNSVTDYKNAVIGTTEDPICTCSPGSGKVLTLKSWLNRTINAFILECRGI